VGVCVWFGFAHHDGYCVSASLDAFGCLLAAQGRGAGGGGADHALCAHKCYVFEFVECGKVDFSDCKLKKS